MRKTVEVSHLTYVPQPIFVTDVSIFYLTLVFVAQLLSNQKEEKWYYRLFS